MIDTLAVDQLKGKIKVDNTEGTSIEISFPKKSKI